ncbi:RNase III domain-containing protein [Favolaschia claudopus]|uniref:RNase III domain-containing protein n=1 Tax=Favolaschia claudopus TaxID=2862362 RepID=A0AAW0ACV7_9AGAR
MVALASRQAMSIAQPFGPVFWGVILNLIALGMTLVQALTYLRSSSRDRVAVRLSVSLPYPPNFYVFLADNLLQALAMVIFDLASSFLIIAVFWTDLILDFGDISQFQQTSATIGAECTLSACIALLAQVYFIIQIKHVKPAGMLGNIVLYVLGFLSIIGFGFGLGCATFMVVSPTTPHYNIKFQVTFGTAKGANALCDIIATTMMCLYLKRSKTGITSTEKLLDALTYLFMNRGALVMVVQVLTFVFFWAYQNPQYWLAPHLLLTKVYVNTFCDLNSRTYLREKHLGSDFASSGGIGSTGISTTFGNHQMEKFQAAPNPSFSATITKDTLVRSDNDSYMA